MARGKHENFQFFTFMRRKQIGFPQDIHKGEIKLYVPFNFLSGKYSLIG